MLNCHNLSTLPPNFAASINAGAGSFQGFSQSHAQQEEKLRSIEDEGEHDREANTAIVAQYEARPPKSRVLERQMKRQLARQCVRRPRRLLLLVTGVDMFEL